MQNCSVMAVKSMTSFGGGLERFREEGEKQEEVD